MTMPNGDGRTESAAVSRRNLLKKTGALGLTVGVGTASTASADHTGSPVCISQTEAFWNEHSDPQAKLDSIRDYCQSLWDAAIEDDDGNYNVSIYTNSDEIPESQFAAGDNLDARRQKSESWLETEDNYDYDYADAHIVLDYTDGDDALAIGPHKTAGQSSEIVGIVDTYYEDNDELPYAHSAGDGTEALTMRPLLQMYSAQSPDHVDYVPVSYVPNVYSVMYNYEGVGCDEDEDDGEVVRNRVSPCTKTVVRDYMQVNGL